MKKRRIFILFVLAIAVAFFLGPQPETPTFKFSLSEDFPNHIHEVSEYISDYESQFHIRPENEGKVYWSTPDSVHKTEYSIVYLHGFSASPGEGLPIHKEIATAYGMNLYVPRLDAHGIEVKEPLMDFSGEKFINSAYEAIKVGELLGDKVIVMSCSTGGTASLFTTAYSNANIHAQIMYSPNCGLYDSRSGMLTMPWGLQIARLVKGGDYNVREVAAEAEKYWYEKYRLEAVVELQNMLEHTMISETYSKVKAPSFVGYYYKNEEFQDDVVSISDIKKMISSLAVPKELLTTHAFEDVRAHALQSRYFSKDLEEVRTETEKFMREILGIKKPA